MRLLINCLSLTHGGGRSYVRGLLRELGRDARGCDVTVLAARGQLEPADAQGLRLSSVCLPAAPAALRTAFRVLYEELVLPIAALRYDVLYCVADMAPAIAATPTLILMSNLNVYDRRFYDNARLRVLRALARLGQRRARRLLFPTRAAADLIGALARVPAERMAILPYGIDTSAFGSGETILHERPFLLLPAALERHKNIGMAIDALAQLRRGDLELWLVGPADTDPRYAGELAERARALGVADRVRFIGPVAYTTMLGYYRAATALVFPSAIETFGFPILEAMAAGTPIVASDIPTFRELAGDAARYFALDDPAALAAAVEEILADDRGREQRRRLGIERAAAHTWSGYADRLCALFREAIGSA